MDSKSQGARELNIFSDTRRDLSVVHAWVPWCSGILSSCRQANYVFNDIENSVTSPVNENDISFENDSLPIVR